MSDQTDPAVLTLALKSLTSIVNTTSLHTLDEDKAISLFEELLRAKVRFSAGSVQQHLASLGWSPSAISTVTKISSDVLAGKRLRRTATFTWPPPGRIDEWRASARKAP